MIQRIVDGEIFEFPEQYLSEFDFWFGSDNAFKKPMYSIINGKVGIKHDTGMCGAQAIITRWVPLEVAMADKCRAVHLGSTEEKKRLKRFGKPRKIRI